MCAGAASATPSPSPERAKPAAQKMLDRLESVYESGKVMPVAFLPAAAAAPLALLNAGDPPGAPGGHGELNEEALKLVSQLAMEGALAAVPQHLRASYMKQVRVKLSTWCCVALPWRLLV